jgi:hypothetical protein
LQHLLCQLVEILDPLKLRYRSEDLQRA